MKVLIQSTWVWWPVSEYHSALEYHSAFDGINNVFVMGSWFSLTQGTIQKARRIMALRRQGAVTSALDYHLAFDGIKNVFAEHEERYKKRWGWWYWDVNMLLWRQNFATTFFFCFSRLGTCTGCPQHHRPVGGRHAKLWKNSQRFPSSRTESMCWNHAWS